MKYTLVRIKVLGEYTPVFNFAVSRQPQSKRGLMGPILAGLRGDFWGDLPAPKQLRNRRARFYFTLRGWHHYGQHVFGEAIRRGMTVVIERRKRPRKELIVYQDRWQVAITHDPKQPRRADEQHWHGTRRSE